MKLIICLLLVILCYGSQLDYSLLCMPYDANIDFVQGTSTTVISGFSMYVAKNLWTITTTPGTLITIGGSLETKTLGPVSMIQAISMLTIEISKADCDYTIDDTASSVSIFPGVNCWPNTGYLNTKNVTINALGQSNPKFIISSRSSIVNPTHTIDIGNLSYTGGAVDSSFLIWSGYTTNPLITSTTGNLTLPGSVVAKTFSFQQNSRTVTLLGQLLTTGGGVTVSAYLTVLGAYSRLPLCAPRIITPRNANVTISNNRVTFKNFADPGFFRSNVTVNGTVATAYDLPSSWQVTDRVFTNDEMANITRDDYAALASNISRTPCTILITTNTTFTTRNITVYGNEHTCFDGVTPTMSRFIIFDARSDPNAIFYLRGVGITLDLRLVTSPVVLLNGAQYRNIITFATDGILFAKTGSVPIYARYDGTVLAPFSLSATTAGLTHYGKLYSGNIFSLTSNVLNVNWFYNTTDDAECPGWTGINCQIPLCYGISAQISDVCSGRGTCVYPDVCSSCSSGWGGSRCELPMCYGVLSNSSSVCSGRGTCVTPDVCSSCTSGWSGSICQHAICHGLQANDTNVCSGRGSCVAPDVCSSCDPAWGGEKCEIARCFGLLSNDSLVCSGRANCTAPDLCSDCQGGYSGFNCHLPICYGLLSNDSLVCSGTGVCSSPDNCTCNSGYEGTQCEISIILEILAAQTTCATQLRNCTLLNTTDLMQFPSTQFSSISEIAAIPIYYDVQITRETIILANMSFVWLLPNGSYSNTQPNGTWTLLNIRSASCADNYTGTYPIFIYTARFTSTFGALYEWFNGSLYTLPSVTTDLIFGDIRSLATAGTLQFGSRETSNCSVRLEMYFSPIMRTTFDSTPTRRILGITAGSVFVLAGLLLIFIVK